MTRVTIDDAKANLSRLIEEVRRGGDVVILRGDKPIARLLPIEPTLPPAKRKQERMKGQFALGHEFFEALPEEELQLRGGRND